MYLNSLMNIKTSSDLRFHIEQAGTSPFFFTRRNMRFAGDTMRNFGVRKPVEIETQAGQKIMAYELFRRKPTKYGLQNSFWFCAKTFNRVHPK